MLAMHTAMKPLVQATSSHHTAKTLAQSGSAARTSKKAVPYNLSIPGTLNLAGNTVSVKTGAGGGTGSTGSTGGSGGTGGAGGGLFSGGGGAPQMGLPDGVEE